MGRSCLLVIVNKLTVSLSLLANKKPESFSVQGKIMMIILTQLICAHRQSLPLNYFSQEMLLLLLASTMLHRTSEES
jgi:hypothetical protein